MSVTNSADKKEDTSTSLQVMEQQAQQSYSLPGHCEPPVNSNIQQRDVEWVRNTDGTLLIDHRGNPITVDRMLATKPLRGELSTRPGPGNRKLTYLSGEGVTRTLNDIFGFDGWNLDIKRTQREVSVVRNESEENQMGASCTFSHCISFLIRNVSRTTTVAITLHTQLRSDSHIARAVRTRKIVVLVTPSIRVWGPQSHMPLKPPLRTQ
jgi:hypothetical protein